MSPAHIDVGSTVYIDKDEYTVHDVNKINEDKYIFILKDKPGKPHLLLFSIWMF
jgi:mRNA degradation ribonuclease J1/J2